MTEKKIIEQVLEDWNYWNVAPKLGVMRSLLEHAVHLEPDLVLVVQGVRRCGKSTLLAQIAVQHNLDWNDCCFVNFEDPRLSDQLNHRLLDEIVTFAHHKRRSDRYYFFFDEIQNVENWQKWLHSKLARCDKDVFVITGSNAALLSGDLGSSLTGRHVTLELFPFDFFEYQQVKTSADLCDYLHDGGFPRALSFPEPDQLLREYFTDIIERDVRRHVAVRSTLLLTQLVKTVFECVGSEVSFRNIAKSLDIGIETVKTYIDACESAYMVLPCPYFTFSEKQALVRNKKYYPVDLGLRRAVITKSGEDRGKNLETIVYHELRRRHRSVFYWRQKGEVDFVVQSQEGIWGYQVSWDDELERHKQANEEFLRTFPQAKGVRFVTSKTIHEFLKGAPGY